MSCRGFKWGPKRLHPDGKGVSKPNGSYHRYSASATSTQPLPPNLQAVIEILQARSFTFRADTIRTLSHSSRLLQPCRNSAASGFVPNTTFEFSPRTPPLTIVSAFSGSLREPCITCHISKSHDAAKHPPKPCPMTSTWRSHRLAAPRRAAATT